MKQIKAHGTGPESACLDSRTWALLSALIVRTYASNVARLFKEHRFLDSLEHTVLSIANSEEKTHTVLFLDDVQGDCHGTSSRSSENPEENISRENRKRKRGHGDPTPTKSPGLLLYTNICNFLGLAQNLTLESSVFSQSIPLEHLKASLRAQPNQAAKVLGCALRFTNNMLSSSTGDLHTLFDDSCRKLLNILWLWESAAEAIEGPEGVDSHLSFAKHSLIPILDHLDLVAGLDQVSAISKDQWVKSIEKYVISNIILPSREAYLNANRPEKLQNPDIPKTLLEDLLSPLRPVCDDSEALEAGRNATDIWQTTALRVARILRLAAENPPRNTAKQIATESSWLQKLFSILLEMSTVYDAKRRGNLDCQRYTCHYPLLRVARSKELRVDRLALKALLLRQSGLFIAGSDVDWNLINVCMELDSDMWILSNHLSAIQTESVEVPHDTLLSALLQKLSLTSTTAKSSPHTPRKILLHRIIYPLIQAFVRCRSLMDFLEVWREQIAKSELKGGLIDLVSVWEEDDLISYVSKTIRSALTYPQISSTIDLYSEAMTALSQEKSALRTRHSYMVILDSIMSADYAGRALEEIRPSVNRLSDALLSLVDTEENVRTSGKEWMLLMLTAERWRKTEPLRHDEERTKQLAVAFLEQNTQTIGFATKFCTLRLATRSAVQRSSNPVSDAMKQNQANFTAFILDSLKPPEVCEMDESQLSRTASDPMLSNRETHEEHLRMLFANIILVPEIMDCLPIDVLQSVFQSLYDFSNQRISGGGSPVSESLIWLKLWWSAVDVAAKGSSRYAYDAFVKVVAETMSGDPTSLQTSLAARTVQSTPLLSSHPLLRKVNVSIINGIQHSDEALKIAWSEHACNDGRLEPAENPVEFMHTLKCAEPPFRKRALLKRWGHQTCQNTYAVRKVLEEIVAMLRGEMFLELEPLLLLQEMIGNGLSGLDSINATKKPHGVGDETSELGNDRAIFTRILNGLCNTAGSTSNAPSCIVALRCINSMLRSKARSITQWHIDSIMACITIAALQLQHRFPKAAAAEIHTALTRVFGSILAAHRLKLGGRYHMILPALQALLHCLFIPFKTSKTSTTQIDHSSTFSPSHAGNLSRILSSICDPTVSAVAHRRLHKDPKASLNDETKKARKEASKHMLYFIMDYCILQLSSRMVGEGMRERLLPGIWAVLNVMSKEIMSAMNAQLSVEGREIWKELYAEWRREGRASEEG